MSEGAVRRPVGVRLVDGDPAASRIESVARRLDLELVKGGPGEGRCEVGDVSLPADASEWMVEAALLRAQQPGHVLFLCVANSARSQMAEGLARHLVTGGGVPGSHAGAASPKPGGIVRVSSAGSEPSTVRPQAVTALAELGIDISSHRSTGVDEVEGPVDAVVTLCAEEVCPVWLSGAFRLHWGLRDPAAVEGSEKEKLQAFREVRDELRRRLHVLFRGRLP